MNCPYCEPNCPSEVPRGADTCPDCRRFLKECRECGAPNRSFANFCRACGAALAVGRANWATYKGSVSRAASHEPPRSTAGDPGSFVTADAGVQLQLGDVCRSLLGYDRHLFAVAQNGTVDVADPRRPRMKWRFQVHGPVTAEPCIDRGVLYVGSRGQVAAYSIGTVTAQPPRLHSRWRVPVAGAPVHALTVVNDRLYVTVANEKGKAIVAIDDIHSAQPPAARVVHAAERVSWIAADPERASAAFLSGGSDGLEIHSLSAGDSDSFSAPLPFASFAEQAIAFLGGKMFAVFDDGDLYRVDAATGDVEEALDDDTQLFALTRDWHGEWDRDGVRIDNTGVVFWRSAVKDTFAHVDRAVKASPLIFGRRAAVVGMEDGRVLLYDLVRPPRHDVWRLGENVETPITALACFDCFIAAGNRDGIVGVRELRAAGAA